jgi:hypothetical protein
MPTGPAADEPNGKRYKPVVDRAALVRQLEIARAARGACLAGRGGGGGPGLDWLWLLGWADWAAECEILELLLK